MYSASSVGFPFRSPDSVHRTTIVLDVGCASRNSSNLIYKLKAIIPTKKKQKPRASHHTQSLCTRFATDSRLCVSPFALGLGFWLRSHFLPGLNAYVAISLRKHCHPITTLRLPVHERDSEIAKERLKERSARSVKCYGVSARPPLLVLASIECEIHS